MPTYQYACTECAHAFDQVQRFTDDTLTECPRCQGRLRKLFNAVGVVFKGSGFYRTDSRAGADTSEKAPSGTETSSDSKGSESSGGATESPKPSGSKDSSNSSGSSSAGSKDSSGTSSGSSKSSASTGS